MSQKPNVTLYLLLETQSRMFDFNISRHELLQSPEDTAEEIN